jgi:predicted esterase
MKFKYIALLLFLTGSLSARPFTDVSGKVIEAEFVSVANGMVTISKGGHPFTLPLNRFSKADQDFIAEQGAKTPNQAPTSTVAGKVELGGKEISRDGKVNLIEVPLTEEALKETRKNKDVTGVKIAIALPSNFDPAVPQKILWLSAAINNDGERKSGNVAAVPMYAGTAVADGWAVVAVDCNRGNPRGEDNEKSNIDMALQHQAVAMLSAAWPGFSKSTFVCAGFSGGAKSSFCRVGQLATVDLNVVGLFLAGCNQDMTEVAKDETKVSGSDLRKVKVFVSNGKSDTIATVAAGEMIGKSVDKSFGEVRIETFEGGHSVSREHLKVALAWFLEPGKAKGK